MYLEFFSSKKNPTSWDWAAHRQMNSTCSTCLLNGHHKFVNSGCLLFHSNSNNARGKPDGCLVLNHKHYSLHHFYTVECYRKIVSIFSVETTSSSITYTRQKKNNLKQLNKRFIQIDLPKTVNMIKYITSYITPDNNYQR